MKRLITALMVLVIMAVMLTGCGKKKEEEKSVATETYVEENEVQVVYHDTEDVNFKIGVADGVMREGLERLIEDAEKEEAANHYMFYEYKDYPEFEYLWKQGVLDLATIPLDAALEIYRENSEFLCVLAVNAELEDGYGVVAAKQEFAKMYPLALQVFIEEMKYSAKECTCIDGEEMKTMVETYLTEQDEELPGDEFYYPLPEAAEDEIADEEAREEND